MENEDFEAKRLRLLNELNATLREHTLWKAERLRADHETGKLTRDEYDQRINQMLDELNAPDATPPSEGKFIRDTDGALI